MADCMNFPATVEEFMEQYKITDTEQVYTNGVELIPIFRMKQWFEHLPDTNVGNIEYIRKADAIKQCGFGMTSLHIADNLRKMPSADVVPVVHSRWIKTADGAECDNCGREAVYQIIDGRWQYEPWCPHCGAKMDKE